MSGDASAPSLTRPTAPSRWRLVLPLFLMAAIALASHAPLPVGLPGSSDKLVHAAAFGLLAALWFWARLGAGGARRAALTGVTLAVLWGALDEWHQSFVPGRTSDVLDFAADAAGALAAGAACLAGARAPRQG